MRRMFRVPIGPLAVIVLLAAPARAQVQTGSILVKTIDEQGAVMPGVTVTLSSSMLVAGQVSGTTDAGGVIRFPSLTPGMYSVKSELQGFQTLVRDNVVVPVGLTVPLDVVLKVATVAEAVTVSGESPVVDTTTANVHVTLSQQLLQATPGGRDIWALLEYKVPGLVMSRPDVGGTNGGLQGTYTARGTPSSQNSQFLNGVNVGDPAAIGAAGYYYDFDAFDEIQVSTGAHDISVPTSGVFLNMATKTGGQTWAGQATFTWEGGSTQSRNIDSRLANLGFAPNTNSVDYVSDISVQAGGPILKNKLRFFGSFRDWRVHINVPAAFSTTVLDETNITSGLTNVTWQINKNNKFTGFYSRQYYKKPNRFLGTTTNFTAESNSNEDDVFNVYQGLWNSIITSRMFMDARVSYNTIFFPLYFNGTDQTLSDQTTGILLRNANTEVVQRRPRLQASATFQYYLDQALGGRHELRFGIDQSHVMNRQTTRRWDDLGLTYRSATNAAANVTLFSTPIETESGVDITALFLQDSYTVGRLTVTGGVRYERLEAFLPDQQSPPSRWFPSLTRSFEEQRNVVLWHNTGPRVSAAYDLFGNSKTALKFAAGRYYYQVPSTLANNVNANGSYSEQWTWNDANGDLHFQPGEQTGTRAITAVFDPATGELLTRFAGDFRRPFTNELTLGIDHELIPDLRLAIGFGYRTERYPQASFNPDNIFSSVPSTGADPGIDGVTGTADDGTFIFYDRIVGGFTRQVITNDPTYKQKSRGLEITATKRMSNRWQMLAGYTYGKGTVEGVSVSTSPNNLINANGRSDRPHTFKITGTYILPYGVVVAGNLRSQSGPNITRQINQQLGIGGSTSINLEPLGAHRVETLTSGDLRVGKILRFGGREIEGAIDFYNITNANTPFNARSLTTPLSVRQNGDPNGALIPIQQFLSPSALLAPRIIRFGVTMRF
jgi:hypothetical protein